MLAVQLVVHARHLARGPEAQAEDLLHEHHEHDGHDGAVHDRHADAEELDGELREGVLARGHVDGPDEEGQQDGAPAIPAMPWMPKTSSVSS